MDKPSFGASVSQSLVDALRPIRALKTAYLPLLFVYFAYGALGLIDISRDMWVKERLALSACGSVCPGP